MRINLTVITLLCLALTLLVAYSVSRDSFDIFPGVPVTADINNKTLDSNLINTRPLVSGNTGLSGDERLAALENDIAGIKQQLTKIELVLQDLSSRPETPNNQYTQGASLNNRSLSSALNRRLFDIDNLINAGIDPSLASDIVRRKNAVELQRLELQDMATRNGYLNSPRYFDELEAINRQDISLRDELGNDLYDEYLYNSNQNNRVKIVSVMLGSAAEQAGIQEGDIVLSYDSQSIFNWRELKSATTQGVLGEYVLISINRDGEIFTYTVPRGPLGIQLGSTRMPP